MRAFLACFAEGAYQFYILRILCLSGNVQKSKASENLSENTRNKHRYNVVLCEVHAYTVTVSFRRST